MIMSTAFGHSGSAFCSKMHKKPHRGDKRGESSAHTRFPHNFHLFSRKNTIFSINLLFLDAKLKIIVNYEL